ncbi:MAG: beta-ketoacyl-ACP synthase III [Opitutales bacterium]
MSRSPQTVIISGTGSYLPERVVTNEEMEAIVNTSDEWIRSRTGIRERRFAAPDENTSDMACAAGERALEAAGIGREDIDLVIVATMTPDMPFPATACLVQNKMGLRPVPAFDIQAACSGFPYALSIAAPMLQSGQYRHALVIAAEKTSPILDFQDRTTCVLFGDGAGAAILSLSDIPDAGILGSLSGSDGSEPSLLYQPAGGSAQPASEASIRARGHFLKMNGREIFKLAVRVMGQVSLEILERFDYDTESVDLVIPHQANMRIIDSLAKRLALPMEKFHNNLDRYGNTSAASVGIALDEAFRAGRIQKGSLVLLVSFGAGLTWSATLFKWH